MTQGFPLRSQLSEEHTAKDRSANLISIPLMHLLLSAHLVMDGEDMSREMCGVETDVCVNLRVEKKMFILKMLPL